MLPTKGPRKFLTLNGVISGRHMLHTHTEGTFRPPNAKDPHIYREILSRSPVRKRSVQDRQRTTLYVLTELSDDDKRRFGLKLTQFRQAAFSSAPDKRPKKIPDPEWGHLRSTYVTHAYRGYIQTSKCKGPSYLQGDSQDSR